MPCDSIARTPTARENQRLALTRLESALNEGLARVVISASGAVAFSGWAIEQRGGLSDVCAYRRLVASNSPALRRAVFKAETMAGRKVDARQVAAGTHSHDGGSTWHKGH